MGIGLWIDVEQLQILLVIVSWQGLWHIDAQLLMMKMVTLKTLIKRWQLITKWRTRTIQKKKTPNKCDTRIYCHGWQIYMYGMAGRQEKHIVPIVWLDLFYFICISIQHTTTTPSSLSLS